MNTVKEYLDAVDKVCVDCMYNDNCDGCPVRLTVDSLYDFAKYEIWFAKEDEEYWKDYYEPTKKFKNENVEGVFRTGSLQLFIEVLYSLTEEPTASWFWVFVDGVPATWGAMDTNAYNIVAEYVGWGDESL